MAFTYAGSIAQSRSEEINRSIMTFCRVELFAADDHSIVIHNLSLLTSARLPSPRSHILVRTSSVPAAKVEAGPVADTSATVRNVTIPLGGIPHSAYAGFAPLPEGGVLLHAGVQLQLLLTNYPRCATEEQLVLQVASSVGEAAFPVHFRYSPLMEQICIRNFSLATSAYLFEWAWAGPFTRSMRVVILLVLSMVVIFLCFLFTGLRVPVASTLEGKLLALLLPEEPRAVYYGLNGSEGVTVVSEGARRSRVATVQGLSRDSGTKCVESDFAKVEKPAEVKKPVEKKVEKPVEKPVEKVKTEKTVLEAVVEKNKRAKEVKIPEGLEELAQRVQREERKKKKERKEKRLAELKKAAEKAAEKPVEEKLVEEKPVEEKKAEEKATERVEKPMEEKKAEEAKEKRVEKKPAVEPEEKKPEEKPVEKKPVEKPVKEEKRAEEVKPAVKPEEKPAEKRAVEKVEKPEEKKQEEKPEEKPAVKPEKEEKPAKDVKLEVKPEKEEKKPEKQTDVKPVKEEKPAVKPEKKPEKSKKVEAKPEKEAKKPVKEEKEEAKKPVKEEKKPVKEERKPMKEEKEEKSMSPLTVTPSVVTVMQTTHATKPSAAPKTAPSAKAKTASRSATPAKPKTKRPASRSTSRNTSRSTSRTTTFTKTSTEPFTPHAADPSVGVMGQTARDAQGREDTLFREQGTFPREYGVFDATPMMPERSWNNRGYGYGGFMNDGYYNGGFRDSLHYPLNYPASTMRREAAGYTPGSLLGGLGYDAPSDFDEYTAFSNYSGMVSTDTMGGLRSASGLNRPVGPVGSVGPNGAACPNGPSSPLGFNGPTGLNGPSDASGPTGAMDPSGPYGARDSRGYMPMGYDMYGDRSSAWLSVGAGLDDALNDSLYADQLLNYDRRNDQMMEEREDLPSNVRDLDAVVFPSSRSSSVNRAASRLSDGLSSGTPAFGRGRDETCNA